MKIKIEKGLARGKITPPPSKSYAHRQLISSFLSNERCEITGVSESDDMKATLNCISALGGIYEKNGDKITILGKENKGKNLTLNCLESGSTIRFFIPISLIYGTTCTFLGSERLLKRGFDVYFDIFKKQGIKYELTDSYLKIDGRLKPDTFTVRGDISSQFITGLLFALPLLDGDSVIEITTPLESKGYVDITIDVLKNFGIEIKWEKNKLFVKGNQKYLAKNTQVEADLSNGAFLDAFNVLGGDVDVLGINEATLQADYVYKELFKSLSEKNPTINLSNCPDLGPIMFALASYTGGACFEGTRRLKIKESDRCEAMAVELKKMSVRSENFEDRFIVYKSKPKKPKEILNGHNDHRIVMALSVLLTTVGGEIEGCEAVNKSYPTFFEDLTKLGIKCERS